MIARGQVSALGLLEGVREATYCRADGTVIESSSGRPELEAAGLSVHGALNALQASLPSLQGALTVAIDAEQGTVHFGQDGDGMLVVSTTNDANIGAVRLEMREALRG